MDGSQPADSTGGRLAFGTGAQRTRSRADARVGKFRRGLSKEQPMLGWAIVFGLLALVAGFLGFVSLAGLAASIAKILFVIFLVLLVISFVIRAFRGDSVV